MKIVVIGGTTALGQQLIRILCASLAQAPAGGEQILSLDVVRPGSSRTALFVDDRVGYVSGDVAAPSWLAHAMGGGTTGVFVLARALARDDAEAELRATADATRALLDACRARPSRLEGADAHAPAPTHAAPRFVLVCNALPQAEPAPLQRQRARRVDIARLLVADYADRGLVDGRIVELPSVVLAPDSLGEPDAADVGAWLGWALNESIAGRPVSCPDAFAEWSLMSGRAAADAVVEAHDEAPMRWAQWPSRTRRAASIRTTASGWVECLRAVAPAAVAANWSIVPRAPTAAPVPAEPASREARGTEPLPGDADLESLVRASLSQAQHDDSPLSRSQSDADEEDGT